MTNKYAVIDNSLVVNVVEAEQSFAQSQGWVEFPEYVDGQAVSIGWTYSNGQFIPPAPFDYSEQNKMAATSLLQQTDWTTIPDVANPAVSNPYLTNALEFASYRSQVRAVAVNPPSTLAVFPTKPDAQWSTQ